LFGARGHPVHLALRAHREPIAQPLTLRPANFGPRNPALHKTEPRRL